MANSIPYEDCRGGDNALAEIGKILAHVRKIGISGFGIKSPDFLGAWACSACHAFVDSHHDDATQVAFYEGVFRTQAQLLREAKLHE